MSALQTQVYARSWERRVIFTGPLTGPALEAAYGVADLLVLPSRFGVLRDGRGRGVAQPGGFYGGWVTSRVVGPFKGDPGTMFW